MAKKAAAKVGASAMWHAPAVHAALVAFVLPLRLVTFDCWLHSVTAQQLDVPSSWMRSATQLMLKLV